MIKALPLLLKELGWQSLLLNGLYRLGKASGAWRVLSRPRQPEAGIHLAGVNSTSPLVLLPREQLLRYEHGEVAVMLASADEIVAGSFRAYGDSPRPIDLDPGDRDQHWSAISDDRADGSDIKDTWEPARFGWVFPLIRANQVAPQDGYAQTFMDQLRTFNACNPPYQGSNWVSGQEAALRIIAILCGYQAFHRQSPDPTEMNALCARTIFHHAQRIPPTLLYARSQQNNHLLSEAAGLYTAGVFLRGCKRARKWRQDGWHIFHQALSEQIDEHGEYIQHSTNYQRLMLHLALWVFRVGSAVGDSFPRSSMEKLEAATGWLWSRMAAEIGQCVNLGHNDGSHLLTLGNLDIRDYQPTIATAARAFMGCMAFPRGAWDELGDWLGLWSPAGIPPITLQSFLSPDQRLAGNTSWGMMRSAKYTSRPAHADQLHFDLWFQGANILMDAGTYRYTAPAPWRNALAGSVTHNTITIDQQDQMMRKGRFLWLDRANAYAKPTSSSGHISAFHDGYKRLGCIHQRDVYSLDNKEWRIVDAILLSSQPACSHQYQLHWLLPMGSWQISGDDLLLQLDDLDVAMKIKLSQPVGMSTTIAIIQAGKCLHGDAVNADILGWHSWTYGRKDPATSILFKWECAPPTQVETTLSTLPRAAKRAQ